MAKAIKTSSQHGRPMATLANESSLNQLFQQVIRERQRSTWFRLTPQERLVTLSLIIGGATVTLSSLAWAAAVSYMQHQRVRQVKLAGIADEHVAQLAAGQDNVTNAALSQLAETARELAAKPHNSAP